MTSPFDKVCPYCRGLGAKNGVIYLCIIKKDIQAEVNKVNDLFDLLNVKEKPKRA